MTATDFYLYVLPIVIGAIGIGAALLVRQTHS